MGRRGGGGPGTPSADNIADSAQLRAPPAAALGTHRRTLAIEEGGDVTRLAHTTGSPGNAALGAVGDLPDPLQTGRSAELAVSGSS
jgi:beta-N-acetylhexosaminidase